MTELVLKEVPRLECLLEFSKGFPTLNPKSFHSFIYLIRVSDQIRITTQNYFTKKNITKGRFLVMMYLFAHRKGYTDSLTTAAELADQSSCSRATMTGLVDSLEKDGFVQRTPDEDDRRVIRLAITPKGEDFMNSMLPAHFESINAFMNVLTDDEHATLVALLQKLSQRLSSIEPLVAGDGR